MNKVKKNFIFLSIYKIFEMLLPIITSPLLSRRLGADSLGIYSYTFSIVTIFGIIAQLGVYNYGMREIAKVRDDNNKLNQVYSEIFYMHLVFGIVILIIYCCSLMFFNTDYLYLFLIQICILISNIIDNCFLFIGIENIKIITIRDAIIKIISFLGIVFFVRKQSDLYIYALIMGLCPVLCKLYSLFYARHYVKFVRVNISDMKKHFVPMFLLMIPLLASTIYHSMDKIMIGNIYSKSEVGYYECSLKALIPRNIITALCTAMCPHIAYLYSNKKYDIIKTKIENSLILSLILSYSFTFGICIIANDFAPLFWGTDFSVCGNLLVGLSISIPFWCVGEVIRNQYLLPVGKDKEFISSFIIGVIINLILNFILIPIYGTSGAIFATIVAEFVMSFIQSIMVKDNINVINCLVKSLPYFIICVFMMLFANLISSIFKLKTLYNMFLKIIVSVLFFGISCLLYEVIFKKSYFILKYIKRRRG